MTLDKSRIRAIVRDVVNQGMPNQRGPRSSFQDEPNYAGRELITEQEVMKAHREGRGLVIAPNAVVTPSARDAMSRYGVREESTTNEAALVRQITTKVMGADSGTCRNATVALGSDHGGFEMKESLAKFLADEAQVSFVDLGTYSSDSVDYPDFAAKVAQAVASGDCCFGIIVDGAGIGSAMAANKVAGIRAAHCSNVVEAKNAREHNDANVLTLGGRVIGDLLAKAITAVFLSEEFAGGRHQGRVDKIIGLER